MVTSLQKILEYAEHENIGIGAFNIGNKDIFDSILKAAELTNSPVIVECAPAEIDFLGDDFFSYVRTQIENSRIPICLHLVMEKIWSCPKSNTTWFSVCDD